MAAVGTIKPLAWQDWDWCLDASHDMIQGITVPGGVVMSPVEVLPAPSSIKQLQEHYYEARGSFRIRRGPASTDEDRLGSTIDMEVPPAGFPHPVSLVSPPILLQKRTSKGAGFSLGFSLGV